MRVNSIFRSIQGEGVYQGIPMTFIRLQGCNFSRHPCTWCDTRKALNPEEGREISVKEIVEEVVKLCPFQHSYICITGGEPMLQKDELKELVMKLRGEGYIITIETNGSYPPPTWMNWVHSWIVDFKCPSSGNSSLIEEWRLTKHQNQVKFVVLNEIDLAFTKNIIENKVIIPQILISPVIEDKINFNLLKEVAKFCLDFPWVRYSVQLHKLVGFE